MSYAIGIEIGGTKLQAGLGLHGSRLAHLARLEVNPELGAEGIRQAIPRLVGDLLQQASLSPGDLSGIGVGFGGPVNSKTGVTLKSHQINGWDRFPLRDWLQEQFHCPVTIQNDASTAGYAEAALGAGSGFSRVFYMTIGSGIGGGWILDGTIDEGQGLGAAEIGHTWVPDPETGEPEILEKICSGWSIGRRAQEALEFGESSILSKLAGRDIAQVTAKTVYQAAEQEDLLALSILDNTCLTLALAICNMVALYHPQRFIIGGGVSLMGPLFWDLLQEQIDTHLFAPFADTVEVVPATLGEEVVVIGAVLLGQSLP